jgi:DIS3-like exonuclease 2
MQNHQCPRHPPPPPREQVRSSLGQAGDLASETAALLAMEGVRDDDQFSPEVGAYARVGQGRLPPRPAHPGPACAVDVPPPCLHLACTLPPLPQVLACLPPTPWCIGDEELAARRDFRAARVFSIDPPTARDLDDALSGGCRPRRAAGSGAAGVCERADEQQQQQLLRLLSRPAWLAALPW